MAGKFILAFMILGMGWPEPSRSELLYVNANRWIRTQTDLTALTLVGTNEGFVTQQVLYGQNLWLVFSDLQDATWAEVVLPDGSTNDLIPADPSTWHRNLPEAAAAFHVGAEIGSAAELNSFAPSGMSYLVRFGGGTIGTREDQIFIPSDTGFFANPPQAQFSSQSMERLSAYDAAVPVPLHAPGDLSIQTTNWSLLFWESMPYTVPADTLQPGVVYLAGSTVHGTSSKGTNFAGLARTGTNSQIFLSTLSAVHDVYFRTRPPHLRLTFKEQPAFNAANQTTSMQVQLASNPNYDAYVEFAEGLQGFPVWMQASALFGTNGTASVFLQKGGDYRTNWSKQMFFRVRNKLTPVTAEPNPPQATPF
jgi:hypothetical protein